jgi:uncharacterized membrane protein
MTLVLAFLLGLFAGLRSLTAPATTAWAAYPGWLRLQGPLALIGSIPSVAIFTLLAIVELMSASPMYRFVVDLLTFPLSNTKAS